MTIKAPDPISFVLLHRCLNCLSPAFSQPESRPLHLYFLVCTTLRFPIAFVLFIVLLYLYCLSAPFSQPVHCTKINSRPPLNAVFYVLLLNGDAFVPICSFFLSFLSLFAKIFQQLVLFIWKLHEFCSSEKLNQNEKSNLNHSEMTNVRQD